MSGAAATVPQELSTPQTGRLQVGFNDVMDERAKPPITPGPEPDTSDAGVPDDTDSSLAPEADSPLIDESGDVVGE